MNKFSAYIKNYGMLDDTIPGICVGDLIAIKFPTVERLYTDLNFVLEADGSGQSLLEFTGSWRNIGEAEIHVIVLYKCMHGFLVAMTDEGIKFFSISHDEGWRIIIKFKECTV